MIFLISMAMAMAGFFWSPTWYVFVLWEMPAAVMVLALIVPPLCDAWHYWFAMRSFGSSKEPVFLPGHPQVASLDWHRAQRAAPVEEAS